MKYFVKSSAWALCATAIVAMAGCAGGEKGPSDEELVMGVIMDGNVALQEQDIAKATIAYSDDFEWDQGGKEEYVTFLTTAKEGGFLDDMEINTENMVVVVDGVNATAGPIVAVGTFGELTLNFELEKRDGQWVVTGQRQS